MDHFEHRPDGTNAVEVSGRSQHLRHRGGVPLRTALRGRHGLVVERRRDRGQPYASGPVTGDPCTHGIRHGYGRGNLSSTSDNDYWSFSGRTGDRLVVKEKMDEVMERAVRYQQTKHLIPTPAH